MDSRPTIFMTGATSGLGKVSALKAANSGASLIILVRNKNKGEELLKEFKATSNKNSGSIEVIEGNLNSLKSISEACHQVKSKFKSIDMLVLNAGIMNFEHKLSKDQVEETLQVNLLSPILICHLLYENLKKGTNPKIIFTASGLHQGVINFENIEFKDSFSSFKVYRQSKLGIILICRLLAEELDKQGIGIYCQHPGVVRTDLGKDAGWFSRLIFHLMGKSPEKGSETLTFMIETPKSSLKSGEYYANKVISKTTDESYDLEMANKLRAFIRRYLNDYLEFHSPFLSKKKN